MAERAAGPRRVLRRLALGVIALAATFAALFVGLNVLVALGFWLNPPIQPEEEAAPHTPRIALHPASVPGGWPLTVPADSVDCHPGGAVLLPLDELYALNDAARAFGYRSAAELARPLPGGRRADLTPLRRHAEARCRTVS